MAFLDKLNSLAKTATDMANETIEITRLNTQISSQQSKIAGLKNRLGEHVWLRYKEEETSDETVAELCQEIGELMTDIENKRAQIQALKGASHQEPKSDPAAVSCPGCGADNAEGAKFCRDCGAKLEPAAAPEPVCCPSCGTENPYGTAFCSECGAKLN